MAKFVELENGNLLSTSCITLMYPHAGIKYDSEKIKVHAAIRVEWADDVGELISATWVAPWPYSDNEVEFYELMCSERKRLEEVIRDLLPGIVRGLYLDLNIYYPSLPSLGVREQLQQEAKDTAERIAEEVRKMEEEQNE
jgi:hypothetical protein